MAVVSHETAYGAVVSSAPSVAPSRPNCTPATPTLSEALAVTLIVPFTGAPLAGAVMLTVGGVVSLETVTVTGFDVHRSEERRVGKEGRAWGPLLQWVVFQETADGAVMS